MQENSFPSVDLDLVSLFIPSLVYAEGNLGLIVAFSDEEVEGVVFQLNMSSASGTNGFDGFFYRAYWDCIGVDVTHAV